MHKKAEEEAESKASQYPGTISKADYEKDMAELIYKVKESDTEIKELKRQLDTWKF